MIQKKVSLLNKLGDRTLLVVPNTTPGPEDSRDLFDLLTDLQCRVIFVVQSVPRRLQDYFPVVSVGPMEDDHLFALFFHYYDLGEDEERIVLEDPLRTYFRYVGGHTKTVELTAEELREEYIYPSELPDVLAKITSTENDELSERIFRSLSGLFDLKKFDGTDKRMLLCAALLAETAVPEETLVDVMRKAGVFNGARLHRLTDLGWIDRNAHSKTLSMNAILCSVCLAQIPLDDAVIGACFGSISDDLFSDVLSINKGDTVRCLRSLQRLCQLQGYPVCAELAEQYLYVTQNDGIVRMTSEKVNELQTGARSEWEKMPRSIREACDSLINLLTGVLQSSCLLYNAADRSGMESLEISLISSMMQFMDDQETLDALNDELFEEHEYLAEEFREIALCRSLDDILQHYLRFLSLLIKSLEDAPEDDLTLATVLCMNVGRQLNYLLRPAPYLRIRVLRGLEELIDKMGGHYSATDLYMLEKDILDTLASLSEDPEEMESAFGTALKMLNEYPDNIFTDPEDAEEAAICLHTAYINAMIDIGLPEKAEEACRSCWGYRVDSAEMFKEQVNNVTAVNDALLAAGKMDAALHFLEDALPVCRAMMNIRFRQEQSAQDAYDTLETLDESLRALKNPRDAAAFADNSREYKDYYKTFGAGTADRRLTRRYNTVAERAIALDYSALSEEEISAVKCRLADRAGKGESWESLAPEAFALVSEAGYRVLGYRLHYVQCLGSAAIFNGNLAEIYNGEGKTYAIVPAAFLHVLYGRQVHILDQSAYLCRRNYAWMRGVLEYLGCTTALITNDHAPDLPACSRADVIYGVLSEVGFCFMHQQLGDHMNSLFPLKAEAAILDEADEALLPERPVLQITSPAVLLDLRAYCRAAYDLVSSISPGDDTYYTYQDHRVTLRMPMYRRAEQLLEHPLTQLTDMERNTLETILKTAVEALHFYRKDKDYFISADQMGRPLLVFEDVHGNAVPFDNTWAYFLWKKEGREDLSRSLRLTKNKVISHWSVYAFLRSYRFLGGASATLSSLRQEIWDNYRLSIFPVPPNLPVIRRDELSLLFATRAAKHEAIVDLVRQKHLTGQPVLVICENAPESRQISGLLRAEGIENTVFNAMVADDDPDCLLYAGEMGRVTVTTALANRGVDISLGGSPSAYAIRELTGEGIPRKKLYEAIYEVHEAGSEHDVLRRRYTYLCSLYRQRFAPQMEAVEQLGGLCVIGTTCFDDLRTEQQLRGRSGRQGSPGESHVYYSMEDAPLRILLRTNYQMMSRVVGSVEEGLSSPILERSIYRARLRLQHSRYSRMDRDPDILYFARAREIFLGPLPGIRIPAFDHIAFLCDQLEKDPRHKKDLADLKNGKTVRTDSLTAFLAKKGLLTPGDVPHWDPVRILKTRAAELLEKDREQNSESAQESAGAVPLGQLRDITAAVIKKELTSAWASYLAIMSEEIAKSSRIIDGRARYEKYMTEYSSSTVTRLYGSAIEKSVMCLIGSCSGKASPGTDDKGTIITLR